MGAAEEAKRLTSQKPFAGADQETDVVGRDWVVLAKLQGCVMPRLSREGTLPSSQEGRSKGRKSKKKIARNITGSRLAWGGGEIVEQEEEIKRAKEQLRRQTERGEGK